MPGADFEAINLLVGALSKDLEFGHAGPPPKQVEGIHLGRWVDPLRRTHTVKTGFIITNFDPRGENSAGKECAVLSDPDDKVPKKALALAGGLSKEPLVIHPSKV
jgi:hypothetical protein